MENKNAIVIDVPKAEGRRFLNGSPKMVMDFTLTIMEAMGQLGIKVVGTAAFGPSEKNTTTMMINTGNYPTALMMDVVEAARKMFISSHCFDIIENTSYKGGTAHILLSEDFLTAPKTVADITEGETAQIVDTIISGNLKKNDIQVAYDLRRLDVDITFDPRDMSIAVFRTVLRAIVSTINRPWMRYGDISISNHGHRPETVIIRLYTDGTVSSNALLATISPDVRLLRTFNEKVTGRDVFKSIRNKEGHWNHDYSYYIPPRIMIDMNTIQKENEGR